MKRITIAWMCAGVVFVAGSVAEGENRGDEAREVRPDEAAAWPEASEGSEPKRGDDSGAAILTEAGERPREAENSEARLAAEVREIWASAELRRGKTAVYVADAVRGTALYRVHADDRLNPASNVKLVSTAAILDALGPTWRYASELWGQAPAGDGVITGALSLRGSYDPTLDVSDLRELAHQLVATGVRRIEGDVVIRSGDARDLLGQPHLDITVTATRPGRPPAVVVQPASPLIEVVVTARTTRRRRARPLVTLRSLRSGDGELRLRVVVSRRIGVGRAYRYGRRIAEGALFTAQTLRTELVGAGIEVAGVARTVTDSDAASVLPAGAVVLARHFSAPASELVAIVNKDSDNQLADRLLMTAGAAVYGEPPALSKGIQLMDRWLERQAGIDPQDVYLDSGSGLSYRSKLTAEQIVRILRTAAGYRVPEVNTSPPAENYRNSLAVAGEDGTLRHRFIGSDARGHVVGKTGTLRGVVVLSGIVSLGEDALCFAIVTNGTRHKRRAQVRHQHERMVEAMLRYLQARNPHLPATELVAKAGPAARPHAKAAPPRTAAAPPAAVSAAAQATAPVPALAVPLQPWLAAMLRPFDGDPTAPAARLFCHALDAASRRNLRLTRFPSGLAAP